MSGEAGRAGVRDVMSVCDRGTDVFVEHHERDVRGPAVADDDDGDEDGAGGLKRVFDVDGRHVLAGRVDDEFFLAVDDGDIAVVVLGQYDVYEGGVAFNDVIEWEVDFLRRHADV